MAYLKPRLPQTASRRKKGSFVSCLQLVDKVDKLFYYEGKTREKWRKGTMLRPHQEDGRYTEKTVKLDD
ncbi:hypothetical protein P4518_10100, partial [Geobacillus thermodenitrificans]|uniref:hypothetical protein n=1 Tax=Geobacillus thermodenitrificans TaxID=33940 RepID=UPI002E1F8550|nr:hypothetical protein [Geobacillus thermodenitrificans]